MSENREPSAAPASRRDFLKATAAGTALAGLSLVENAHAAGGDTIKVGLIGCGGRGSGAAHQCVNSAPNVKIVAIGDVFQYRIDGCRRGLKREGSKVDLPDERCFVGLDAYEKVINAGVDLVILATPPGFRPQHLEAAIAAGKHVFTEKPVAVDGPGIRKVLAAYEEAKKKKLAVVAGTQRRHQNGYLETLKRVHGGEIGDILSARAYWNGGNIWFRPRDPKVTPTDVAYQLNNWYHFVWTCGDHIVEQHVHNLDVINWALKSHPIKAMGMGGRSNRAAGDPNVVGQIFDHFAVEYEYPNGVVMQSYCRQIEGCASDQSEALVGTKGTCRTRDGSWTINHKPVPHEENAPYVQEHTDLIRSIREGKPLNELQEVAYSTLTAIMGRMSTYTGKTITWKQALESKEDTFPQKLTWDMSLTVAPPAVPGKTKFV